VIRCKCTHGVGNASFEGKRRKTALGGLSRSRFLVCDFFFGRKWSAKMLMLEIAALFIQSIEMESD